MTALGEVAPALAARAAERLFMTPPRHRARARERQAMVGAEPFTVRMGSGTLRCWRFGEGQAVLLVHGWGGRAGQLASFAPWLGARGLAAVTFDAPAHGESSGRVTSMPQVAQAIAAVAEHTGARAAIGHSMGAAALALAMSRGTWLDAAVFVAPPRNPAGFFDGFCRALGLSERVGRATRRRLERRVGLRFDELDVPGMGKDLATPVLVLHDADDTEVPWEDGAAIAEAWPGARLLTTAGLGHRRILRESRVVGEAVGFLSERLERCACGKVACGASGPLRLCAGCLLSQEMYERPGRWPGAV